jgi:hypothetical protein
MERDGSQTIQCDSPTFFQRRGDANHRRRFQRAFQLFQVFGAFRNKFALVNNRKPVTVPEISTSA